MTFELDQHLNSRKSWERAEDVICSNPNNQFTSLTHEVLRSDIGALSLEKTSSSENTQQSQINLSL